MSLIGDVLPGVSAVLRRGGRALGKPCVLVAGLHCNGCLPIEPESQESPPPSKPTVDVYSFRITNVESGVEFSRGCAAFERENELPAKVQAQIPLGVVYDLELEVSFVYGSIGQDTTEEWFCSDKAPLNFARLHDAPSCYKSLDSTRHELIDASVVNADGVPYAPKQGDRYVDGRKGDKERFRLRSFATGVVGLNRYDDCPPKESDKPFDGVGLMTVLPLGS